MALFIQSQRTSTEPNKGYFLCPGEIGVGGELASNYIGQQPNTLTTYLTADTVPPISAAPMTAFIRCYVFPVDASDPTLFGIFTHYYGRRYWAMCSPTYPAYNMRYYVGDFPPAGPHPTIFKIAGPYGDPLKYIYSPFYGKYFKANTGNEGFTLVTTPSDSLSMYNFWNNTSSGPVIPTPSSYTVATPNAQYMIVSRHKKALSSSALTTPYLSQATINFSDDNQKFFFRAQETPYYAQPNLPFTYNIFFVATPDTMLCIEDNGSISIRTAAGSWEKLFIQWVGSDYQPNFFGRFKIQSLDLGLRLRANADGSVTSVSTGYPETLDDYFSFIPLGDGIPYPYDESVSALPPTLGDHPDGTIVDIPFFGSKSDASVVDTAFETIAGPVTVVTEGHAVATRQPTAICRFVGHISTALAAILYFLLSFFLLPFRTVGFWASYACRKPSDVLNKHSSA